MAMLDTACSFPTTENILERDDHNRIMDLLYQRLRDLLNNGSKLPSFDKYLETWRFAIWDKFGNKCSTDLDYLIMDGLRAEEYTLFKQIIQVIKKTSNHNHLNNKLNILGQRLYQHRQRNSLAIAHYSFHGYVHILLRQHLDKFTKREVNELHGLSLMLEHAFTGIGDWMP